MKLIIIQNKNFRKKWFTLGEKGGTFFGMKAALVMCDQRKNGVYKRIILAGGGVVIQTHSMEQLLNQPLSLKDITHVFIDPWVTKIEDSRNANFNKLKNYFEKENKDMYFLYYKYLFMKVRQHPEPSEAEYSIFEPKIQEKGEKDYKIFQTQQKAQMARRAQQQIKRPIVSSENGNANKKLKEAEVVTLESSDDEDENEKQNTGENVPVLQPQQVSQLRGVVIEKVVSQKEENTLPIVPEKKEKEEESDSDDDILILEQKLASAREESGSNRTYMERVKATGESQSSKERIKKSLTNAQKRPGVNIISQREEYMRRMEKEKADAREASRGQVDSKKDNEKRNGMHKKDDVQLISLSDDESSKSSKESDPAVLMVTLDDSESDNEESKSRTNVSLRQIKSKLDLSAIQISRVRAPSPPNMQLDQDERQDTDEEDDIKSQKLKQMKHKEAAPDVFNIDSSEDEDANVDVAKCIASLDDEPDVLTSSITNQKRIIQRMPKKNLYEPQPYQPRGPGNHKDMMQKRLQKKNIEVQPDTDVPKKHAQDKPWVTKKKKATNRIFGSLAVTDRDDDEKDEDYEPKISKTKKKKSHKKNFASKRSYGEEEEFPFSQILEKAPTKPPIEPSTLLPELQQRLGSLLSISISSPSKSKADEYKSQTKFQEGISITPSKNQSIRSKHKETVPVKPNTNSSKHARRLREEFLLNKEIEEEEEEEEEDVPLSYRSRRRRRKNYNEDDDSENDVPGSSNAVKTSRSRRVRSPKTYNEEMLYGGPTGNETKIPYRKPKPGKTREEMFQEEDPEVERRVWQPQPPSDIEEEFSPKRVWPEPPEDVEVLSVESDSDGDNGNYDNYYSEPGSETSEEDILEDIYDYEYLDQHNSNAKQNLTDLCVNVSRMSNRKFELYNKEFEEYNKRKSELESPLKNYLEPISRPSTGIVPQLILDKSDQSSKTSTSLLYRIIATLHKRFALTEENVCISNLNCKTAQFDKFQEIPINQDLEIRQVHQNVEIDFARYFKKESDGHGYFRTTTIMSAEDELACQEGITSDDSATSIKRLKMETTFTAFPSSKILNILMKKLLLDETDFNVISKAYDYLNHFLFLHLGKESNDRDTWLSLVCSAFRNMQDEKLFKTFDISNSQELFFCWSFWKEIFDKAESFASSTKDIDHEIKDDEYSDAGYSIGPNLLITFLVKMLQKDFEIWWKKWRKKDIVSEQPMTYPLIYYILGGSRKDLLKNISKTVLKLYKRYLIIEHSLADIRKILAMCAMLISHLDFMENYGALFWGEKRSFAILVSEVYEEAHLTAEELYFELSLVQPNWFSVMVSHSLMTKFSKYYEKVTGLFELRSRFSGLSISCDIPLIMAIDNYAHRLCSFQQIHSIFRANWHYSKSAESEFQSYKYLNNLEDTGIKTVDKIIKFEDILFRLASTTDSISILTDFANNKVSFLDEDCKGDFDDIGALRAMFFNMQAADDF